MTIKVLNEEEIRDAIDCALNAACYEIQRKLGQTDGGVAGVFFTGEARDRFNVLMRQYIELEFAIGD